jgi:2'-5' RNA ligase
MLETKTKRKKKRNQTKPKTDHLALGQKRKKQRINVLLIKVLNGYVDKTKHLTLIKKITKK